MQERFWVIGGEYSDTRFCTVQAVATALGPYTSYAEARKVWFERSVESRPLANVRYTIAVERSASPGA
jgi:hypothetical protein